MLHEEEQKQIRSAMKVFLSIAILIYGTALVYSFITKNLLGEILLLCGGALAAGIIIYSNKKNKS